MKNGKSFSSKKYNPGDPSTNDGSERTKGRTYNKGRSRGYVDIRNIQ
jgi:hypothetical protein